MPGPGPEAAQPRRSLGPVAGQLQGAWCGPNGAAVVTSRSSTSVVRLAGSAGLPAAPALAAIARLAVDGDSLFSGSGQTGTADHLQRPLAMGPGSAGAGGAQRDPTRSASSTCCWSSRTWRIGSSLELEQLGPGRPSASTSPAAAAQHCSGGQGVIIGIGYTRAGRGSGDRRPSGMGALRPRGLAPGQHPTS